MRFFVALAVALVVTAASLFLTEPAHDQSDEGFHFDGSIAGDSAIVAPAPDPRVVWYPYSVGGFKLCSPETCLTIPPGATLWVPVLADGTTAN